MTFLRVDSSIRVEGSVTRAVGDTIEKTWTTHHPDATIVRRNLVSDPASADVWATAAFAGFTPVADRTPEQLAALAVAASAADELLAAEVIVIGAPLYNFGVSQHLKAWIDLLITDPRFSPGTQPLAGKTVTLVTASGGGYGAGTPREGWNHATPYLLRIFGDVFGGNVELIGTELTLAPLNPAMAQLIPASEASAAQAHEQAADAGRRHVALVAA